VDRNGCLGPFSKSATRQTNEIVFALLLVIIEVTDLSQIYVESSIETCLDDDEDDAHKAGADQRQLTAGGEWCPSPQ
jgi:hypothetical protein